MSVRRWAAMGGLAAALLASGCETGRTNKMHAEWERANDITTTGKAEVASTQKQHGQPPVPGSPTAAGEDGNQPPSDSQARKRVGNEKGLKSAPNRQPADSPERTAGQG